MHGYGSHLEVKFTETFPSDDWVKCVNDALLSFFAEVQIWMLLMNF